MNNEKVICDVKEITADAVKFSYPGEDLLNTVYKNRVKEIIFDNGRVQTFSAGTSLKKVNNVDEFEKVTVTAVEGEIKGLYKLGVVSSKAKGTTTLSNQERVKERAYRKLKTEAAMMGANIIYITNQRTEGNKAGYFQSSSAEASLSGVAYTNNLPDYEEFKSILDSGKEFTTSIRHKMWSSASEVKTTKSAKDFKILEVINDNGIITLKAELEGESRQNSFRLAHLDKDGFSFYYEDKSTSYNYEVKF
ncbi:hypothetical protein [Salegentibacter chungangensis]|uniref:Uncharacterized protein n=1 Tax=Salegentibacter chungangensis TaxID=1335724 RepID=A0ABW3NSH1_9FLAO